MNKEVVTLRFERGFTVAELMALSFVVGGVVWVALFVACMFVGR